jgi:hypothetical protein
MLCSAYALAEWLLNNWWRLVREPERNSLSWEMSHRLGAIRQGFLWPNLTFSSDGSAMLKDLADELCQTELRQWREIEALLGYDADEAPEKMVNAILAKRELFGTGAIDEMLAPCSENPLQMLDFLYKEVRPLAVPMVVPGLDSIKSESGKIEPAYLPWQSAAAAVHVWNIPDGALSNKLLMDLFSLPSNAFTPESMPKEKCPITVGFRKGIEERIDSYNQYSS